MVYEATWLVIALVLFFIVVWLLFMIWGFKTGQIKEAEKTKFQVFKNGAEDHGAGADKGQE